MRQPVAEVLLSSLARTLASHSLRERARDFIFGRSTTIPSSTIYDIAAETPVSPRLFSEIFVPFLRADRFVLTRRDVGASSSFFFFSLFLTLERNLEHFFFPRNAKMTRVGIYIYIYIHGGANSVDCES